MRKLCPNLDKEDGLETVLEVPIPEEMLGCTNTAVGWNNLRHRMKAYQKLPSDHDENLFLLKIVGSALIPFKAQSDRTLTMPVRDCSIEASTARYIVQQYVAATGGLGVLNSIKSMYAVGEVKMVTSDVQKGGGQLRLPASNTAMRNSCEVGGFVLWQKNPDLWFLELVICDCKISAGSDGKVAWTQSSSNSKPSKGPPRPLRMFFQGLDPRSTANLFLNGICIGEKKVGEEECFIVKMETSAEVLKAQSTSNTKVVHHTMWGSFSQRTGLLIQFQDTKLVRLKTTSANDDDRSVFWETNMESVLEGYRYVEGVNIAHGGKTTAMIYRYGDDKSYRAMIEETWRIDEIDFNICGLCQDSFLAPAY
ncbi:unnamed protein product [Cuscuta europaea]|uniref:Uncharacterized protein n=1 Tax=Cuscuta europaea TaxID=41803 RepID=A0A9P1DVS1_CUSEU|nr:unnamed protein product [Cuscuta europaea]